MKKIFYKNTNITKTVSYTWCGIVDKNGRMLKKSLPTVINDFKEYINEATEVCSDIVIDADMYKNDIVSIFPKKYFKMVNSELHFEMFEHTDKDRGRYGREKIYLYKTWDDALYNIETFFKGVVWFITSLRNLNNYIYYIDNIRVYRCNHDFVELYGEDALEIYSFDDIINSNKKFILDSKIDIEISKKYVDKINKKKQKIEPTILDNGMLFTNTQEKINVDDIPALYDYCLEIYKEYKKVELITNDIIKRSKQYPKTSYDNCTMNKKKIHNFIR